jgi:glutamate transport system substrate-binding protein
MKMRRMAAAAAVLTLTLTGCGGSKDDETKTEASASAEPSETMRPSESPSADSSATPMVTFAAGSSIAKLKDKGKITIGIKFDQPGIGVKDASTGKYSGFDVEIARIIADELGIDEKDITFKEAVSSNREPFLKNGTVDLVIASYSITDARREVVGQAGPYYVTGQQILVRDADKDTISGPDDVKDKKVCSVTGSTSIKTIEEKYKATPVGFKTYTECVSQLLNKSVDAVTTDGAILLGYAAAHPGKLAVVGDAFSEERYGIGFKHGDDDMCRFLRDTLTASFEDGSWEKAFEETLGKAGDVKTPEPPKVDASC